jgi:hypothetical protein
VVWCRGPEGAAPTVAVATTAALRADLLAVFLVGGAAGWVLEELVDDLDWPSFLTDRDQGDVPDTEDPLDDDAEEAFLEGLGLSRE